MTKKEKQAIMIKILKRGDKKKFNPNKINQFDKDWEEEISDNWQKYLNRWLEDYKNGIYDKADIIKVISVILNYKRTPANLDNNY